MDRQIPDFRQIYEQLSEAERVDLVETDRGVPLTLSVEGMPLVSFARHVADLSGISVVVSERLDDKAVSVEVRDVEVGSLLALVARRLGVELTYSGGVYFIGELRAEDRGVYVRRVRRLDQDGLKAAVATLLSNNGRVSAYDDGLVVVADRVEVLHRVSEVLDQVEVAGADSWVVQVHFVSARGLDFDSFGLDVTPALDVAASFATSSDDLIDDGFKFALAGGLQAVLNIEKRSEAVNVVAAPLFVLVDGGTSRIVDGDDIRIPQYTVSDQGTQRQTGFERVQTGLEVEVGLRDMGGGRARLRFVGSLSSVVGFTEGLPNVNQQRYETVAVIRSGGVYLLGSLQQSRAYDSRAGGLRTVEQRERVDRTVFVWVRAYRIGRSVLSVSQVDPDFGVELQDQCGTGRTLEGTPDLPAVGGVFGGE